jgi:SAM-dependent methyltransferase
MTITETALPDLTQVKRRQQQMWASGDYQAVATLIQPVADRLCDTVDLQAGWRVLDVATGSGNAALAAARCGCQAVGIDYVPALLARARRRAEAEGLEVELLEADAERLPFRSGSFDSVLSVFGAMFAPNHARTADELVRVCRPGGRLGLASWTPDGFVGELLGTVGTHVPSAPRLPSPLLWGSEHYLAELFGDQIHSIDSTERTFSFRFASAEAFVDYFRSYYGPTLKAFESVGETGAEALHADLVELVRDHAGTGTGPVTIPSTYLEAVAIRSTSPAIGA